MSCLDDKKKSRSRVRRKMFATNFCQCICFIQLVSWRAIFLLGYWMLPVVIVLLHYCCYCCHCFLLSRCCWKWYSFSLLFAVFRCCMLLSLYFASPRVLFVGGEKVMVDSWKEDVLTCDAKSTLASSHQILDTKDSLLPRLLLYRPALPHPVPLLIPKLVLINLESNFLPGNRTTKFRESWLQSEFGRLQAIIELCSSMTPLIRTA